MKTYYGIIGTLLLLTVSFGVKAQVSPTSSPYYSDGPYSITTDSTTVSSKKVVMYHPVAAPTGNKYPVFIFQPGANGLFSSAINVHSYDLYLKHLATYGYVVMVIDETSAGLPNGTTFKAVHDWFKTNVANTSHWLNSFADPSKVAIGGHSNGGVNATGCLIDRSTEISAIVYFASYPSNNWMLPQDVSGYTGSVLDLSGNEDATSTPSDCRTGYDSYTNANCAFWVSITGMDHGGFGDYVNTDQPVGSIGRANATATVRHYLVSYLEYIFKNNAVAQSYFQNPSLQPSTTNEYENSCITTDVDGDIIVSDVSLFPNPVCSTASLVQSSVINPNEISIVDMTGKDVTDMVIISTLSDTSVSMNFSAVDNGIYIIYIKGSTNNPLRINVVH